MICLSHSISKDEIPDFSGITGFSGFSNRIVYLCIQRTNVTFNIEVHLI